MNARSSPYQGIRNYEETDWEWFFGRRKDRQIIISNLFSSPLTVYYGASGVGKTSLLLADVVPVLKRIKQPPDVTAADRKRYERVIVVVFRKWQDKDFQKGLRVAVLTAVAETLSSRNPNADLNPENLFKDLSVPLADTLDEQPPETANDIEQLILERSSFADLMAECCRLSMCRIFLFFDQFEEYFRYYARSKERYSFDAQFASLVNSPEIPATVLVSLREDGLSKLDRLQARVPHLLANLLRLSHLDKDGIKEAITLPLVQFNQLRKREAEASGSAVPPEITAAPEFVEKLANEVSPLLSGDADSTALESPEKTRYSGASYLQLLLSSAWRELCEHDEIELTVNTLVRAARNSARQHPEGINQALADEPLDFETCCRRIAENYVSRLMEEELDDIWKALSDQERHRFEPLDPNSIRDTAARVLTFLVTPGAAKMAHSVETLWRFANSGVSDGESSPGYRKTLGRDDINLAMEILVKVHLMTRVEGDTIASNTYEVAHDVLAAPLNKWREEHERALAARRAEERAREEERKLQEDLLREQHQQLLNTRAAQAQEDARLASLRAEQATEDQRRANSRAAEASYQRRVAIRWVASLVVVSLIAIGFLVLAMIARTKASKEATKASRAAARASQEAMKANEERNRADKEATMANEERNRADKEAMKANEERNRASQEATKANEESIRASQEAAKAEEAVVRGQYLRLADAALLMSGFPMHPLREPDFLLTKVLALNCVPPLDKTEERLTPPQALAVLNFTTYYTVGDLLKIGNGREDFIIHTINWVQDYLPFARTPDGMRLVTVERDKLIVWNVKDLYRKEFALSPLSDKVVAVGFSSNGAKVAVECSDGSVSFWDLQIESHPMTRIADTQIRKVVGNPIDSQQLRHCPANTPAFEAYSTLRDRWCQDALSTLHKIEDADKKRLPWTGLEVERIPINEIVDAFALGETNSEAGGKLLLGCLGKFLTVKETETKTLIELRNNSKNRAEAQKAIEAGNAYALRGDTESAIAKYKEAKAKNPSLKDLIPEVEAARFKIQGYINKGDLFAGNGEIPNAVLQYEKAIDDPNRRMRNPADLQEEKAGLAEFAKAMRDGTKAARTGRTQTAVEAFKHAKALNPRLWGTRDPSQHASTISAGVSQ